MSATEAARAETASKTVLRPSYGCLIGGEIVPALSGRTFDTFNPATGEILAQVPDCDERDVDRAVRAAEAASMEWRRKTPYERAAYCRKFAERLRARAETYAMLDALDLGSPLQAMRKDVLAAAGQLDYYAGLAAELKGETIPAAAGTFSFTLREPYGVVGRVIPFNHPILFAARLASPLVAGNALVLKPAEQTPLSALEMAHDAREIFPAGVVNIITGSGPETGAALVRHPLARRIHFTGSVEVGREVMRAAADHLKTVSLELGGKNPMIVFPDADLDRAVEGAFNGMNYCWSQGQSCGSVSRLLLHESIHEEFVARLARRASKVRIGSPIDEKTEMGCLVSRKQFERVLSYIDLGRREGAKLVCGGGKPEGAQFERGYFVLPTIFDEVDCGMRLAQEEIFGPVQAVIRWRHRDELPAMANSVLYGLTASIWTRDFTTAYKLASEIEAGFVWINDTSRHFLGVPFGGYKLSGIGREECLADLLSYTQVKSVNVNLG